MGDLTAALDAPLAAQDEAAAARALGARSRAMVVDHFAFIWRLLRRLGVPAGEVDDAAQQVFIVTTTRLAGIEPGRERAFLYGTAVRTAATIRRDLARRRKWVDAEPADGVSADPSPAELLERREAMALLDEILGGLADDLRVVFVLCEIEALQAAEVAAIQGIPVGTVASRLRRARREFFERLKRLKAQTSRQP
jgi:RNA polymerase sigma-70 factor (ECF subfamily)